MWKDIYCNLFKFDRICEQLDEQDDHPIVVNDWMKELCDQFVRIPKKIRVETKLENSEELTSFKEMDSTCYGNLDLVFPWTLSILEGKIEKYQQFLDVIESLEMEASDVVLQETITYFQFNHNLREQYQSILQSKDKETARNHLVNVYSCCLFYEMMSLGHYIPNLDEDQARMNHFPMEEENNQIKLPMATLLLTCLCGWDGWDKLDFLLQELNPKFGFELNMSPDFDGPNRLWLLRHKFFEIIESLCLDDDDVASSVPSLSGSAHVDGQSPFFYFDAGGYVDEVVHNVRFEILPSNDDEKNGRTIVKLTRQEARRFF